MTHHQLAEELRMRQRLSAESDDYLKQLYPGEKIATAREQYLAKLKRMKDRQIIACYTSCSCCGHTASKAQVQDAILRANSAEDFLMLLFDDE